MAACGSLAAADNADAMGHVLSGLPAPARYGPIDWDPQTNEVTPYADGLGPLNPLEQMEQEIALAMRRAQAVITV